MINKLYVKGREFLNKNYKTLYIFCILFILFTLPLPYYIDTPGGAIKVNDKFKIEKSYKSEGNFHFAYVKERKATPLTYLYAMVHKDWKVLKKEEIKYDNETIESMYFRDRLLMKESYDNAILVAYQKANQKVEVDREDLYVTYITKKAKTTLQNKDQIIKIDGKKVNSKKQLQEEIRAKSEGEISLTVKNEGKKYERKAQIIKENGISFIGVMINVEKKLKTDPTIKLYTEKRESGPSGGLMLSLSIYDALTSKDITKGRKIVGTGTIDEKGNVGEIGGASFKLIGAVKEGADLFIVPKGDNYKEVLKLKKERNYKIKIVAVSTFEEALSYLTK